jgi:hypothetical protein
MSAWIVSKRHIDYMVTAILAAELSDKSPDDLGRMLWRECLASVAYRYPDDGNGERPGPNDFRDSDVDTYTWERTPELTGGYLKDTLACYRYQSCEHPGWEDSEASLLVEKLYATVSECEVPDDAPWGWD